MSIADWERALAERGWARIDLPDPSPVHAIRDRLLARLQDDVGPKLRRLEHYHRFAEDDERHVSILHALSSFYWDHELGHDVIAANLELFRRLVGGDLIIQRCPYLRAIRPGRVRDAAPLHRDTYYGASPFEMSVVVPLTAMDASSAVRVVSGSHVEPDRRYPFEQHQSPDVVRQSPRHELGFPYAPRLLDPAVLDRAEPVPLSVGQVLVFGLSLVHGGGANAGPDTRFSTDIRIANALAPVDRSRGVRADYFVPLCSSVMTQIAQRYQAANEESSD